MVVESSSAQLPTEATDSQGALTASKSTITILCVVGVGTVLKPGEGICHERLSGVCVCVSVGKCRYTVTARPTSCHRGPVCSVCFRTANPAGRLKATHYRFESIIYVRIIISEDISDFFFE